MPKTRIRSFCNSCSRPEWHKPHQVSAIVGILAVVATFGAILLVRPYRCTCCGGLRFGSGKQTAA